ncbi:MAG TPA: 2-oxoglutarate dehydrogenase, E2 component, dihydrolipoamide succinyltransferase [Terriglobales bacterium]|nr:2-oxoglutarate dehydrogenase, E2 component, dihydrolipoamide succinyltransferase [Terriglobales bacterium]
MPTDVIMPQMGESIFEGTLTKWLKKPGDKVQRDEPLFEISTDKVDAEIPAPASGVLQEIKVAEGTTVQVNTVVGVIDAEGAAVVAAPPPAPAKAEAPKAAPAPAAAPKPAAPAPAPAPAAKPAAAPAAAAREVIEFPGEEGGRVRSSPLVRRIAKEHNISLAQVPGTGLGGRISKQDIMAFLEKHGAGAPAAGLPPAPTRAAAAPAMPAVITPAAAVIPGELVPMSAMRKKIAERMVESKRTSAHVHSVFEVDMTRIVQLREREKAGFEQRTGSRLTFTTFFCRAAVQALRQVPIVNSSVEGDNIRYHREINLGVAVSLDWGLIVPVIKNSEEKNFLGLQRAILDLAERARAKKLAPDDVAGGTFTITNPGSYGQMFGLPIIPQPQVAIMGVGSIKKQPVVVTAEDGSDSIAIRSICHISLGYDHRIIDGAVADQFLRAVAQYLENWSEPLG